MAAIWALPVSVPPFSFHFRSLLFHFRSFLFVFVRELAGLRGCGVRTAARVEQVSFPWGNAEGVKSRSFLRLKGPGNTH